MTEDEINRLYCNGCDSYLTISSDDRSIIINLDKGDIINIICSKCQSIIYSNKVIKELFTEDDYDKEM